MLSCCVRLAGVAVLLAVPTFAGACAHEHAQSEVVDDIEEQTGARVDLERGPDDAPRLPPGVELGDGLSRDEAVAIALWCSPSLRLELTKIDAAHGELAGARRPTNPTLRLLLPVNPGATLATLLTWPIETLATMPGRIALARSGIEGTNASLLQTSLDLSRDVRVAHADWVLAHERLELRERLASQRAELLEIVSAQARLGELSEGEIETARADAAIAADEVDRARSEVEIAESRLRTAIGWGLDDIDLTVQPEPLAKLPASPLAQLERDAFERRPDLDAAEFGVRRARTMLRLERAAIFNLAAVAQTNGPALQLGPQLVVPIFDQNQAGRARARAELEAARWRQRVLRERVAGEVREAHARFEQALRSHDRYQDEIIGSSERACAAAQESFALGDRDFTGVLLAEQQLDLARLRLAELRAEARKSHAELERALATRLAAGEEASA